MSKGFDSVFYLVPYCKHQFFFEDIFIKVFNYPLRDVTKECMKAFVTATLIKACDLVSFEAQELPRRLCLISFPNISYNGFIYCPSLFAILALDLIKWSKFKLSLSPRAANWQTKEQLSNGPHTAGCLRRFSTFRVERKALSILLVLNRRKVAILFMLRSNKTPSVSSTASQYGEILHVFEFYLHTEGLNPSAVILSCTCLPHHECVE